MVFTTDHGYAMPRAKCSLYDPGLAVALMLRLPSRKGWYGGITRDEMISNVDYVPSSRRPAPVHPDKDPQTHPEAASCRPAADVNFSSAPSFMDPSGKN